MVYSQAFREAAIAKFGEVGSYWKAAKILQVSIATLHRWVRQHEHDQEVKKLKMLHEDGCTHPTTPTSDTTNTNGAEHRALIQ